VTSGGLLASTYLQDLQGRAVVGLEKIVQDLGPLRFDIVDKQAGGGAAAGEAADAIEGFGGAGLVDDEVGGACGAEQRRRKYSGGTSLRREAGGEGVSGVRVYGGGDGTT
jgi:hypothetical protein